MTPVSASDTINYMNTTTAKEALMDTNIIDTTVTTTDIAIVIARDAIAAKDTLRKAEQGWKDAEGYVMEAFVAEGISTVLVPMQDGTNTRVTLEGLNETRESVDFDALSELLSPEVLASITKPALDKEKFAAAVEMGLIPAKVVEMVTTIKPVKPTVRVTAKAKG